MDEILVNNAIKQARRLRDMTQQELADAVGVTRQTISLIEAGRYNPTIKLCLLLADVLENSLNDLFWVAEETP